MLRHGGAEVPGSRGADGASGYRSLSRAASRSRLNLFGLASESNSTEYYRIARNGGEGPSCGHSVGGITWFVAVPTVRFQPIGQFRVKNDEHTSPKISQHCSMQQRAFFLGAATHVKSCGFPSGCFGSRSPGAVAQFGADRPDSAGAP